MISKKLFSADNQYSERSRAGLKSTAMKKFSQVMALLMLVSLLVPVIAFGATTVTNVSYTSNGVSADVYTDVYNSTYGNVSLYVYGNSIATQLVASGSAAPTVNGSTYYARITVPGVSSSVYNTVYLVGSYNNLPSSVYPVTYSGGSVAPSLVSISFKPASYSVSVGSSVYASVYASYSDGSSVNVTKSLSTLNSSQTGVAIVNASTGLITGVGAGTTVLTATYGGQIATSSVYVAGSSSSSSSSSSGGIGGGGGGVSGTTPGVTVTADSSGKVDAAALANAFSGQSTVTISITGDAALLPASALVDAAKKDGATVVVSSPEGTYTLPLAVLKLDDLAKALGVNVADLTIKVTISKVTGDTAAAINSMASASGIKLLADAVDFNVQAVSKDGKSVSVDFGSTYVARTLNLSATADSSSTTGVLYDPTSKTFTFVPSTFSGTVATLKRNGNSIYTVASLNKSFSDIGSHWAKADIQLLANKLVIDGMTDSTFAPESNITRGQFAALVVRALGLSTGTVSKTTYFSDVNASDWYSAAVNTAAQAGLVSGYEDGTFRANKQITREELAALVVRALNYAGVKTDVSASQQAQLLAKFTDSGSIVWGQKEMAAAINAGIVNGVSDTTIGSGWNATRAQAAVMLKRLLVKASFIN